MTQKEPSISKVLVFERGVPFMKNILCQVKVKVVVLFQKKIQGKLPNNLKGT